MKLSYMDRVEILLSTQRALLRNITPNMRAITIGYNGSIVLRAYFYSEPSEDEEELLGVITTEIVSDFTSEELKELEDVREEAIVSKEPLEKLEVLNDWVFMREEAS